MATPEVSLKPNDILFIREHSPVGDYFTFDDVLQEVQLHDVVTRKPLQPGQIPEGVLQHDGLREGFAYLQQQGKAGELAVDLVLGGHQGIDDFTNMLVSHYKPLTTATVLGFEMDWRQSHNIPYSARHVAPQLVAPEADPQRHEFQMAQVLWAGQHGKTAIPCELAKDDDSTLAIELRHLWDDIVMPLKRDKTISPHIKRAAATIAERAYQANRQPTLPGQFGKALQELDTYLPSKQARRVALMLGSWHARTEQRLHALDVPVQAHHTEATGFTSPEWQAYGQIMIGATYSGRISLANLNVTPPGRQARDN